MTKSNSRRNYTLEIQKKKRIENNHNQDVFDNIEFTKVFGQESKFYRSFSQILKEDSTIQGWKKNFSKIYHDEAIDFNLYKQHTYLILVCSLSLDIINNYFKEIYEYSNFITLEGLIKIINKFFLFIKSNSEKLNEIKSQIKEALYPFFIHNLTNNVEKGDLFNLFYQEMIFPGRRHKLGEFYTPVPLTELMINEVYKAGDRVLDPACGTGTFLIEAMKIIFQLKPKIKTSILFTYISNLYGIEINPITAIVARLNIIQFIFINFQSTNTISTNNLMKFQNILQKIANNIINTDFLIGNLGNVPKVDLIIGNPPWMVINGIHSLKYKEKLKNLAKNLNIGTTTQNISNLELSSLFFVKSTRDFIDKNGRIFFVTSAGIISGSQNDRLREFYGLKNIRIWKFDKDLFNIHNICIYAEKGDQHINERYRIPVETKICSDRPISILNGKKEIYYPSYIKNMKELKKEILIGRLIPENQLIHFESNNTIESYYRQLFRQGACLGPRNLIFCEDISIIKEYNPKNLNKFGFSNIPDTKKRDSIEKNLALIQPDLSVQYKKYGKWDFKAYEYALVEKEYLFKTVKSTDLIPFVLLNVKLMYLPIRFYDKIDYTGEYLNAKSNKELFYPDFDDSIYSEKHYQFLSNLFQKNIKSGSAINGLFENINHNNKLLNKNQKKNFKVVYNGIGSIVKSAIVRGEVIIDSSLYYISPKSNKNDTDFKNKEAYYLLGMLNAPITTKLVKNMGSTGASGSLRNIHKNPLDSNIPSFNNSKIHIELGNLAKKIEEYVINYVSNYISKQIDLLLTTKSICIKCGKFYNKKNLDSHINKCSKNKDFRLIYSIFNSLNQKEKEFIQKEDISKYLIFNNKKSYINSAFMENPLLSSKIKIIISGILKPKTIQGALFRDLKFSKYLNELEKLVLKIKYNKS